jgi:pyruvate,orthophosphate dikinase
MNGLPCIIRILDPPLHSFFPSDKESQKKLAEELRIPIELIEKQHIKMAEYNPSLGLRGSRIAVMYPEMVSFQAKSIFTAALECIEEGLQPLPCIELPMISTASEFNFIKDIIKEVAIETGASDKIRYKVGLLLEIPRAALTADEIAKEADFMHFGSNDLTQLTCGFSREDSENFIDKYIDLGVYWKNPFISVDRKGVGELMKIAISKGRKAKKSIRFGVAGRHAYDPLSIDFSQLIGIDEISCPASNIPVAKICAAQAALKLEDSTQ